MQTAAVRAMLAMVTATDEIQFRKCGPIPRIPWMHLYTWDSKSEQTRQFATVANHDRKEQLPIIFSISAALAQAPLCTNYGVVDALTYEAKEEEQGRGERAGGGTGGGGGGGTNASTHMPLTLSDESSHHGTLASTLAGMSERQ